MRRERATRRGVLRDGPVVWIATIPVTSLSSPRRSSTLPRITTPAVVKIAGSVTPGDVGHVLKLTGDGSATVQWPKRKGFAARLPGRRSNQVDLVDQVQGPIEAGLLLNNVAAQIHKVGHPPILPAGFWVGSNVTSQVKKGWSDGDRVDVGDPGVVLGPSTRPSKQRASPPTLDMCGNHKTLTSARAGDTLAERQIWPVRPR